MVNPDEEAGSQGSGEIIAALGDRPERLTVVEGTLAATLDAVAAFSGRH